MKQLCHRFLPTDQYNRYQFLLIYQLRNGFTNFYRLTTPGSSLM